MGSNQIVVEVEDMQQLNSHHRCRIRPFAPPIDIDIDIDIDIP